MAQGFSRRSERPRGREIAAGQLEEFMLSGAEAARDWDTPPPRYQDRERSIDELIEAHGGTRGLAESTGRSQKTIREWRRHGTEHITRSSRDALDRANANVEKQERRAHGQAEFGELAQRCGGSQGLADAAGVSRRTAQKWLSGASSPSAANLGALQRADRRYRMAQTYGHLGVSPDSIRPDERVHMKATGRVHAGVGGARLSPPYDYARNIGINSVDERGHELPPNVAAGMFDAMETGNTAGALDALQRHLSGAEAGDPWGYANVGTYSVEEDLGFFIDDFTEFNLQ